MTHLHALPFDGRRRRVGAVASLGQRRRHRRDAEHAPAGGVEGPVGVVAPGAGVEDGGPLDDGDRLARRQQALDGVAQARVLGVALRCHDDAHGSVARERRRPGAVEVPVGHGEEQFGRVGGEQREHHLGLGVAEAHVVLNDPRPLGGQHEPGVEHAPVVDAPAPQLTDEGQHGGLHELGRHGRTDVGHRRVGAHAAGVGSEVAVGDPLEVLGGDERHGPGPVTQHEQRALLADQPLLNHDVAPGVAEGRPRQLGGDVGAGFVEGAGHQHALAGGQSVGLDHPGPGQRLEVGLGLSGLQRVEGREARRRDAGRAQDLLHEGLGPLQERTVGTRPHDGLALGAQAVGQAGHERRLGPDDVQVGLDLLDRHVGDRDRRGHARVARRHDHVGRARQHVRERVLAATAADDADPHAVAKETVCSRPGPTPTRRTGTPICSERKAT